MATVRLSKREKELVELRDQIMAEGYDQATASACVVIIDPKADPAFIGWLARPK